MFRSTAFKLAAWYTFILICGLLIFSFVYYQSSTDSTSQRLDNFYNELYNDTSLVPNRDDIQDIYQNVHAAFVKDAANKLIGRLLYYSIAIVAFSSILIYIIIVRTLRPADEAHKAQARFASDASHELRTPLAAMKSEIEVTLRDKTAKSTDLRKTLRSSLEEVDTLTHITESLLSMARLENIKDLAKQPVNLKMAAMEAIYRFRQDGTRIKLYGPKGIVVSANEANIVELLSILLDNALKYSPKSSSVRVRISGQHERPSITITNQGVGIKSDDIKHLFDRFYRVETVHSSSGFGLGLAIAKRIADLHKIKIVATSKPGKTTTFQVLF